MFINKKNIPLVFTIIYCCLIFAVSSIPGEELPGLPATDYIMHFIEYSGLGGLLCWWRLTSGESWKRAMIQAIIAASLYGMTDEFHQSFVPGRFMSLTDWIADTLGAMLGSALFLMVFFVCRERYCLHLHDRKEIH